MRVIRYGARHPKDLSIKSEHRAFCASQRRDCILDDRLKDRLKVGWRTAYHAQDFTCGGLLLQGLGEVAVPRLQFLEQAHVLDSDLGLIGEGLEKSDLLLSERTNLRATDAQWYRSERLPAATA